MACASFFSGRILGHVACWFVVLVVSTGTARGDVVEAFVNKHCVACHGAQKQESDFRLDRLTAEPRDAATAEAWVEAYRRIEAGDMPPADRPRPNDAEVQAVVDVLRARLESARRAGLLQPDPRGPRRMNRLEYQNTVNDLLGTDLDLTKYLPEDGTAAGFDKVGKALSISPVLVERYLEAADAALDVALSDERPMPSTVRRYTMWDFGIARRTFQRNYIWAERPDAVLLWYLNDGFCYVEPFTAPVRGKYRIRISAYACGIRATQESVKEPVQLALHGGHFRTSGRISRLVDFYDLKWEEPQVIEGVDLLEAGHTFKITKGGKKRSTPDVLTYSGPAIAVQWIEIEGPLDDGAAERRRSLLFGSRDPTNLSPSDAADVLKQFAKRAFRRPPTADELEPYLAVLRDRLSAGASTREALRIGLQAVLCAPELLFLDGRPTIDDYAIADRMSYFLWSTMPDDELRQAAADGKLREPEERRKQVERMLADPRARRFTENFLDNWLDLKKIDATTPDRDLYPEFDESLRASMVRETRAFFDEMLRHDLSVTNFIASDFAMLNHRLARHYGIDGVEGYEIRRTPLPPGCDRGGLLTQASILKVTADGTVTSPVLRGVWLLDRVLGRPVPPPPPGVPGVEPDIRGATTVREQLAKHRNLTQCATCHVRIDPPGFALEAYDPIGGLRDRYRILRAEAAPLKADGEWVKYVYGKPVDAGDVMPDGRRFADVRQFKRFLLDDPQAIAENGVAKLFIYALGREPDLFDREALRVVVTRTEPKQFGLRSLLKELVADDLFVAP